MLSRRERARKFNSSNIFDENPQPAAPFHPQRKLGKDKNSSDIFNSKTVADASAPSCEKRYVNDQHFSSVFDEGSTESLEKVGGKRHLNSDVESHVFEEGSVEPVKTQLKILSPQKKSEIFEPLPDKDYSNRIMVCSGLCSTCFMRIENAFLTRFPCCISCSAYSLGSWSP